MKPIVSSVSRLFATIERAFFSVSALVLISIVLITCVDVGMRYFIRRPLVWSYPLTNTYLMPALFMLALSTCARYADHISIDVLRLRMPAKAQHVCAVLSDFAGCVFATLATVFGMSPLLQAWANDERMPGEDWALWPSYAIVPIGFGLLAVRFLIQCVEALTTEPAARVGTADPHAVEGFE